jgi:ectoine hydroxylase-related dioxygenase (phytanoyl-CoA dioxygenase family)
MPSPTVTLTQDQIDHFHEKGYLSLDAITTPDELKHLREVYDRLFTNRTGWESGDQFDLAGTDDNTPTLPQLLGPSKYAPELQDTLYRANASAIARQLLGNDLEDRVGEHMILKPASYGAPTPWHQDQAYHDPTLSYRNVNFWLPLDDATVESGCLHFVPGSHRMDVMPHHSIGNDPRVHGLEVDDADSWNAKGVACEVPAGGATMHAAYMLHYAGPNRTAHPRRAYILMHRLAPTKRDTPVDNYWEHQKQTARQSRTQTDQKKKTDHPKP